MRPVVLIFGGTSEARELLNYSLPVLYSAATEYGAELASEAAGAEIMTGRLDSCAIKRVIAEKNVACIIDATHPYAVEVTQNIKKAANETGTPLMRVLRKETELFGDTERVGSCAEAASLIDTTEGNVLLTVGSKELHCFTLVNNYRERLYARVLPTSSVIAECEALGFSAGHIIAMQGPFSEAMNEEMISMTRASLIVTKDGGDAGGMKEKLKAAQKSAVRVIVIGRPKDDGHSVKEAVLWARRILNSGRPPLFPMWTDLEGRRALVAGGGQIALRRALTLKKCGANVTVVSPMLSEGFAAEAFDIAERKYESSDLDGIFIAVAATNDREANRQIGIDAGKRNIPVSVADAAGESTYFFPALITENETAVSVSAGALSPALAKKLADKLREFLPKWTKECGRAEEQGDEGEQRI